MQKDVQDSSRKAQHGATQGPFGLQKASTKKHLEETEDDESRSGPSGPSLKDNTEGVMSPRNQTYVPLKHNKFGQNKFGTSFMRASRHDPSS